MSEANKLLDLNEFVKKLPFSKSCKYMASPNNTLIGLGQSITDASGNVWSIDNGQVTVNGAVDPTTANVTHLAYADGLVWQENTDDLWWSKITPASGWSPDYGTSTVPVPITASADDTLISAVDGTAAAAITDASGNTWTIANGLVVVNGAVDSTTANVTHLAYADGLVWQENTDDLWWSKTTPASGWSPDYGTSTVPVPITASADNTLISAVNGTAAAAITDASGNTWTIANGLVVVNGTVDPTTANVTHLAYADGLVWQENTDDLWWSKTTPASGWSPAYGTSTVPVPITGSANDTLISAVNGTTTAAITDASGNTWTIANGLVVVNGAVDPTTANVTRLAYADGLVWQENTDDLWWAKGSPSDTWSPGLGTLVSPLLVSALPVSANDTVVTQQGQTITDANGNVWSINAGGQVVTNGVADPTTANVIKLAYTNGKVWQENASALWWAKSVPNDTWSPGSGTPVSPVPASTELVSANNTVVSMFSSQTITDANHNVWSISHGSGPVIVNGAADPTAADVIAIAYEKGLIWKENSSHLWWAKSSPDDAWLPANGTSASPIPTRTWLGGSDDAASNPLNWSPNGAPQPGDTLQVSSVAKINVVGNDLAGDTLNVSQLGLGNTNVTINASYNAQLDLSSQFSTITLNVADTATVYALIGHGNLVANGGTIQFIGNSELNGSAIFNDNLTGYATIGLGGGLGEGAVVEINGSVGQDLTFSPGGVAVLIIDHPSQFAGTINIGGGYPLERVTFAGLTATSGELLDGMLTLYNGTQVVDSTRVTGSTSTLSLSQSTAGIGLIQNSNPTNGNIPLTHLS